MADGARESGLHDALVHAAQLAHLDTDPARLDALCADIERVLGHVSAMRELDLEGVSPLVHPLDASGRLAVDEEAPGLGTEALMGMAPASHPPFVKVPKVIGGGEGS